MDMRRHVYRWLNDEELDRHGGSYVGRIARVREERLHNIYSGDKLPQPVIYFEDGVRMVPNLTMRVSLIDGLGAETDLWIGQRLEVFRQPSERTNSKTGKVRSVVQKVVRVWQEGAHLQGAEQQRPITSSSFAEEVQIIGINSSTREECDQ